MKPNTQPVILKFIYWHNGSIPNERGEVYAYVHLLAEPSQATVSDLQKIVARLRKTFPQKITAGEIVTKKIESPSHVKCLDISGYVLVAWSGFIPKGRYPGWVQYPTARCEYRW